MVMLLIPTFVLSFIGYHCDKKTFKHVKDNTFGDQTHLTEHQKMLLRIPLNAVKASLISFLPYIIIPMVKYFGNVSDLTRFHCHIALFSFIQGSRIIIILTCLLKANKVNQIELSREQAREERRKWEQETSFKAKKAKVQNSPAEIDSNSRSPVSIMSGKTQGSNQLVLDPALLKMIAEETELAPTCSKNVDIIRT